MSDADDQLALDVDPTVTVAISERRDGDERTLRIGPLPEPDARALAAFLLNRRAATLRVTPFEDLGGADVRPEAEAFLRFAARGAGDLRVEVGG